MAPRWWWNTSAIEAGQLVAPWILGANSSGLRFPESLTPAGAFAAEAFEPHAGQLKQVR